MLHIYCSCLHEKFCFKILITDLVKLLQKIYLTFDTFEGVRGWGKFFDTVVLIYRHWAIMAHCEKLLDIIGLGKYSFCSIIDYSKSRALTQVLMI